MKEWPREDPYDVSEIRKTIFGSETGKKKEIEERMQNEFDKLKAEGKISESLHHAVMSKEIKMGIQFLIFQSIDETKNKMQEMTQKYRVSCDRSQLFLNYSNMIMQIIHVLIEESLSFEYKLLTELESNNIPKYKT